MPREKEKQCAVIQKNKSEKEKEKEKENEKSKEKEIKSRSEEKQERSKQNFLVGVSHVRKVFLLKRLMILLMYKEATLLTNSGTEVLPSTIDSLLQEFQDIVVKDIPIDLPPLRVLNIRLTSYLVPHFQTSPLTEPTQKKQKSCSSK